MAEESKVQNVQDVISGKGGTHIEDERAFLDSNDKKDVKDEKPTDKEDEETPDEDTDDEEENLDLEDNPDEDEDKEKTGDEEDEDKKDEEDEDEEGVDELDEENQSLYQQLKKVNKDIFKEVRGLKSVLYREQEFTKIYPSVEDAKQAASVAQTFDMFQKDIETGNAETLLKSIDDLNKDTFRDFAGNIMPSMFKINKDVYYEVMAPEIKKLLRAALRSDNENIKTSAKNINYFLFGNTDVDKDEGYKPKEKDDRLDKVNQKEKEFQEKQFVSFRNDVVQVATGRMRKIINNSLNDLGLNDLSRKHLTQEIYDRVVDSIAKDVRHNANIDNLWKKAGSDGYTTEAKERIINTWLSRGKVAIPKYRQQVLSEAKVSSKGRTEGDRKKPVTRIPAGGTGGRSSVPTGRLDPKKVNWDKTSERDILDGKVTMK